MISVFLTFLDKVTVLFLESENVVLFCRIGEKFKEKIVWKPAISDFAIDVKDIPSNVVTEISCHSLGGHYLNPKTKTIIDIGGQDSNPICVLILWETIVNATANMYVEVSVIGLVGFLIDRILLFLQNRFKATQYNYCRAICVSKRAPKASAVNCAALPLIISSKRCIL